MNDLAKKWIAALRSGEFEPGKGVLRDGDKFCCLGVACEIFRETHPEAHWDAGRFWADGTHSHAGRLPTPVRDALGLLDVSGWSGLGMPLTDRNDMGHTFAAIADELETNWAAYAA